MNRSPTTPDMANTTAPIPATEAATDLERTQQELAYATAQLEAWTEIRKAALAKLGEAHTAGLVPTKFTAYGYNFGLQTGKTSKTFDAHGKAAIDALQQSLIDQGHCTTSVGAPFWVLRKAKA